MRPEHHTRKKQPEVARVNTKRRSRKGQREGPQRESSASLCEILCDLRVESGSPFGNFDFAAPRPFAF